MSIELTLLAWSILLGLVYLLISATAATQQRGLQWNMSSRDQTVPPLTGAAGRLDRALRNFLETFPFFVALVLALEIIGKHTEMSRWGAILYVSARAAYLPIYAVGIPVVRSLVWGVSLLGLILLLVTLLGLAN